MKLRDWFWLKWNGYCTKHLILKSLDIWMHPYCSQCEREAKERYEAKTQQVLARVHSHRHSCDPKRSA